jgi:hypoxanthine phosphoribosyltransferase
VSIDAPPGAEYEIGNVLLSADQLAERVRQLGAEITHDYADGDLVVLGVLKGAAMFITDLAREIELPLELEFMALSSYGAATKSSGVVRIMKDLDAPIEGRDVLVAEDMVDTGLTLSYLLANLRERNPRSLNVCALLVKPEAHKVEIDVKYAGFEIPNEFIVGYGLDYNERFRGLPYIATLSLLTPPAAG